MKRKIVQIDEEKCNGCGACVNACHEGAIVLIDGKAKLVRDDYCDGLGDCLPACPVDAIQIIERTALPYDDEAVKARQSKLKKGTACSGGCPGTQAKVLGRGEQKEKTKIADLPCGCPGTQSKTLTRAVQDDETIASVEKASQLMQWPVQLKLVPSKASYLNGAKLLVAADCSAYAYARFHEKFMKGHITLMGCPKLDMVDYSEKLTEILQNNDIKSLTIVRMDVPCCGGLENAAKRALQNSGKFIPWQIVTLTTDGKILD